MKRSSSSVWRGRAAHLAVSAAAPLLAAYLYVGPCAGGQRGVVMAFKGWGVSVAAAFCHA